MLPCFRPREHLPLLLVLLVAAWLRIWGLWGDPLYGDEAEYAIVARGLAGDAWALEYPQLQGFAPAAFVSQPPFLLYLMAGSMRLLGPTDLAAALPSAILGISTVLVVYALAWRLAGRRAGLVAGALLAVHPFHVEMSRQAMLDAGFVAFVVLCAYGLTRWVSAGRLRDGLLASLAATLASLSKLPGVMAGLAVLLVAVGRVGLLARRDARRARVVAGQSFVLAVPPLAGAGLYMLLLHRIGGLDDLFRKLAWQQSRVTGATGSDPLAATRPLAYWLIDPHGSAPALIGVAVLLAAMIGLGWAILRSRRDPRLVPVLAVTLAFAAFLVGSSRKEGFYLLPVAALGCVFVGLAAAWSSRLRLSRARHAVTVVALVLAIVPAYASAAETYVRYGPGRDPATHVPMGTGIEDAARIVHSSPDVGVYGTTLGRFSIYWYTGQPTYHWYNGGEELERAIEQGHLRFLVFDDYLDAPHERELVHELVTRHEAREVARLPAQKPHITIYSLEAGT